MFQFIPEYMCIEWPVGMHMWTDPSQKPVAGSVLLYALTHEEAENNIEIN